MNESTGEMPLDISLLIIWILINNFENELIHKNIIWSININIENDFEWFDIWISTVKSALNATNRRRCH